MRRKADRVPGVCAYCGKRGSMTVDHVIPRGLFLKPPPPGLPTVTACTEWNNAKAKDDVFLRDLLAMDVIGGSSAEVQTLMDTTILRAMRRGQSELAKTALASIRI